MPSYAAMMLLTAYLIPYLNNGPFWAYRMWPEAEKCKNYWWTNVLGVSNLTDSGNQVRFTIIPLYLPPVVSGTQGPVRKPTAAGYPRPI